MAPQDRPSRSNGAPGPSGSDGARRRAGGPTESVPDADPDAVDPTLTTAATTPATDAELRRRAQAYAGTVPLDVDLSSVEWEVSHRAKRRAGVCLYDRRTETVTIRLTWAAYREYGWASFTDVIRHELVHAWEFQQFGASGHGERFRRKAAAVDAPRYCQPFSEPRLRLVCTDDACDWTAGRHRACPAVADPDRRRCGDCGARYAVEHVASGERWRTRAGYERARDRLVDDW